MPKFKLTLHPPQEIRIAWIASLLLVLMLVLYEGFHRSSTPFVAGTALTGAPPAPSITQRTLRVATLNIHGGVGKDGKFDLTRTAAALGGYDLIGLNEVHGPTITQPHDQAQLLGTRLGMGYLFLPTERRWWRDDFGNAILTRFSVLRWMRIPLPCSPFPGCRNVTLFSLLIDSRPINLLLTHLDTKTDRVAQLSAVFSLFLSLAEPAILLGDLNTRSEDAQLRELLAAPGIHNPRGQSLWHFSGPRREWILVRGLTPCSAGCTDNRASDHPVIWAELQFPN